MIEASKLARDAMKKVTQWGKCRPRSSVPPGPGLVALDYNIDGRYFGNGGFFRFPNANFIEAQMEGALGTVVDTRIRIEFIFAFGTPFPFDATVVAASRFEGTVDFDNMALLTHVSVGALGSGTLTPVNNFTATGNSGGSTQNYVSTAQANSFQSVPVPAAHYDDREPLISSSARSTITSL